MLLMLENQVVTTGSKDKNNRSSSLSYQARAAASRCLSLRNTYSGTYKISNNILESIIILQTNCQIT